MIEQPDNPGELTPQERAALVAWWLAHGEALTSRDVARLTGLKQRSARYLLLRLARVLPIYRDDNNVWMVCAMQETM